MAPARFAFAREVGVSAHPALVIDDVSHGLSYQPLAGSTGGSADAAESRPNRGVFATVAVPVGRRVVSVPRRLEMSAATSLFELLVVYIVMFLNAMLRKLPPRLPPPRMPTPNLSPPLPLPPLPLPPAPSLGVATPPRLPLLLRPGFTLPRELFRVSDRTCDMQLGIMATLLLFERRLNLNTRFAPWLASWPTTCCNALCLPRGGTSAGQQEEAEEGEHDDRTQQRHSSSSSSSSSSNTSSSNTSSGRRPNSCGDSANTNSNEADHSNHRACSDNNDAPPSPSHPPVAAVVQRYAELAAAMGQPRHAFLLSVAAVESRSFWNARRGRRVCVPLVDFFNHHADAPRVVYDDKEGSYHVNAGTGGGMGGGTAAMDAVDDLGRRVVSPGEQLYISYGNFTAPRLFRLFGMTETNG